METFPGQLPLLLCYPPSPLLHPPFLSIHCLHYPVQSLPASSTCSSLSPPSPAPFPAVCVPWLLLRCYFLPLSLTSFLLLLPHSVFLKYLGPAPSPLCF